MEALQQEVKVRQQLQRRQQRLAIKFATGWKRIADLSVTATIVVRERQRGRENENKSGDRGRIREKRREHGRQRMRRGVGGERRRGGGESREKKVKFTASRLYQIITHLNFVNYLTCRGISLLALTDLITPVLPGIIILTICRSRSGCMRNTGDAGDWPGCGDKQPIEKQRYTGDRFSLR